VGARISHASLELEIDPQEGEVIGQEDRVGDGPRSMGDSSAHARQSVRIVISPERAGVPDLLVTEGGRERGDCLDIPQPS
jgi:hypothetical protein